MTDLSSLFNPYVAPLVASILLGGLLWRWTPLLNREVWRDLGLMFLVAQMGLAMRAMSDQIKYLASDGQTTLSFGNMKPEYFNWPIYIGLFCLIVWSIAEIRFRLSFRREYRAKIARSEPTHGSFQEATYQTSEPEPVVNDNTQEFTIDDLEDAVTPSNTGLRPLHDGRVNHGIAIFTPQT